MSKEQESGKKERQLKDARILMVSRFKSGAIGGVVSVIQTLETYWNGLVQDFSILRIDNQDTVDINSNWDLIVFHHPSSFWIDKFLELPCDLKSKSSVIWYQAVDPETLEIFRRLGVGNVPTTTTRSVKDETDKRSLIANYPGVLNYAISETVRSSLVKSGILSDEKISVVQIPPSLPAEKIDLKGFNERGNGRSVILVVSRISPEKGIENVLEIYKEVFEFTQMFSGKHLRPINFIVVGNATNKFYNESITDQVRMLPTNSLCSIEFLGKKSREELAQLYANAHVFLMPSQFDSWGLVTIEALHYGLPVVAFDAPGTKEIFSKSEIKIGNLVDNVPDGVKSIIDITTTEDLWHQFSVGALDESSKYQPREISLNLLQKLWHDRYK